MEELLIIGALAYIVWALLTPTTSKMPLPVPIFAPPIDDPAPIVPSDTLSQDAAIAYVRDYATRALGRAPSAAEWDWLVREAAAVGYTAGPVSRAWLNSFLAAAAAAYPDAFPQNGAPPANPAPDPGPTVGVPPAVVAGDDTLSETDAIAYARTYATSKLGRAPTDTEWNWLTQRANAAGYLGGAISRAWLDTFLEGASAAYGQSFVASAAGSVARDITPTVYVDTLPWTPPASRDFLRANAWSVTIAGAPWVQGASDKHPERILSWFLDRYGLDWQQRILDAHKARELTHYIVSAADSLARTDEGGPARGGPFGAGSTLDGFVQLCGRIKTRLPYVHCFLGSKVFAGAQGVNGNLRHPNANAGVQEWIDYAFPIMDTLIAAGVVDEFTVAWEWDLWNIPGDVSIQVNKQIGAHAHQGGCSCWIHHSSEKMSWFRDGEPRGRFGYYDDIGTDIDGLMYQTMGLRWNPAMLQARIVDTLHQFGTQGNRHKFRCYEDLASDLFDGPSTEADAARRGFLACCTVDNVNHTDAKVWGSGDGASYPDGRAL